MKRTLLLAAFLTLPCLAVPGLAQDKPAAKPAASDAAPRAPRRARDSRDARECLQLATNREIMVCAEKYR